MENQYRRTWAEINLDHIRHNFAEIQKATKAKICCVIKADGYGHGAIFLAREYESMGADFFAVSNMDEAMQLRRAGLRLPVLILGYTPPGDCRMLGEHNISQCVYSGEYAAALSAEAVRRGIKIKIHVKIDTGMSRLGFYFQNPQRDAGAVEEVRAACALPGLIPEGIFTHFATADEGTDEFTLCQYSAFTAMLEALREIPFCYRHAANSGATLDFPQTHLDMVRAGIILYGLAPSSEIRHRLDLRPALALKSVVSHVKTVESGADISYGREFTAKTQMRIATVPIGYADGYSRILAKQGGALLIHGRRCPIVGRICMDQLMVDLGDLTGVRIGDEVTVMGRDGAACIPVEEIAALQGTINYEVVCDIGARVPRIYFKNGRMLGTQNYIAG